MTYITATLTIIITLRCALADYAHTYVRENTTILTLKQGYLQGVVVAFRTNRNLPPVEQYKGIPYAVPPVGDLRFMPPGSAPGFGRGVKYANRFGPVCPQKFPDTAKMTPERRAEFLRLQQFLGHQSEDCLYLNIYAPYRGNSGSYRRYPVMVFIHGESFEWNSGNPYDGSVLAAYGKVIVVTLNYRLGVLGFLKVGSGDYLKSNFGLVDQIAALLWVKENIAEFGGDPDTVTLFGHGTGAVCANLLMLSPVIQQEHNKTLFQRAILMGGSALSDWALVSKPLHVTFQVANALNCQFGKDFADCLRRRRLDEIMTAAEVSSPYQTVFGPVVDAVVLPNEPKELMTTYSDIFRRFELMYGVTELESIHLLPADALKLGMLEKDRDQALRRYLESRCEIKPDWCVTRTLAEYTQLDFMEDESFGGYRDEGFDKASAARDALLDILSDARTVAPMVQMGQYHSALNRGSFFYVFTHKTMSKEYIRDKSYTGEELPYVFGVPLGGSRFHFTDYYTEKERLFSEVMMTYFSNFAYTGDPKMPRKNEYYTLSINDWISFDVDWPPFDSDQQRYLQLGIPPYTMSHYRHDKMRFWNEAVPDLTTNITTPLLKKPMQTPPISPPRKTPPWILTHPPRTTTYVDKYENFHKPYYGVVRVTGTSPPDNIMNNVVYGTEIKSPSPVSEPESKGISTTVTIAMCSIFLLSNLCLFVVLYLMCYRKRKRNGQKTDENPVAPDEETGNKLMDGCNLMKIVSKSERSEDTYEAVKSHQSGGRFKVARQMSSSTIDAHTKVRDWITNEIVYKYSPGILRRPRQNQDKSQESKVQNEEKNSTLGRSPTRPVSPVLAEEPPKTRPPLVKSSSIPVQKSRVEKVSVAVDATPSGRGPSVLAQQPIELTKSLDRPNFDTPLRRSLTLEDFTIIQPKQELRKSTTSINLKFPQPDSTVVRIEHAHSKSDPVQDFTPRKLLTFDPNSDVNVTSREEEVKVPLTPEESLMTIKRRNFPKVLPDYPSRDALAKKRRSMPVSHLVFSAIPELPRKPGKSFGRLPPAPPLRTTSTLTRKAPNQTPVCQSAPMLAQEPPSSPEPEVACNNLYVGPLIPKLHKTELSSSESSKLNTQPIYDKLRVARGSEKTTKGIAKTIITTDPNQPIKKVEPKVIIKPTMARNVSDPKKHIPRVVLREDEEKKPSLIPTLVKGKESSSEESTPSEESDTGTVVKRL
ncbi:neuroligin-3 [Tribolium castaneum]|uniref:Neuroligin-3-like Protein n=1 Tax=Tribolium castaneum TaxID=7070 RepID=A0A139WI80_TRICA|nr:PREDICTED: neuroligin-3 [Tribolium castaneum]KYB27545.1 Neuroligin-3-like Protein [Tribolium castaneum]|eukprot:XP_008192968.1 PREDICTED: neuroligin-3 [Tribolium castaneum]